MRIDRMMATPTSFISFPDTASDLPIVRAERRRRISPQAGRALEKLAHAIEYLADEFVNDDGVPTRHDDRLEAIQLLMSLNRIVYYECSQAPTLRQRIGAFFRLSS